MESVVGRGRAVGEAAVLMWRPMDLAACQESAEVATGTCGCALGVAVGCWMPGKAISGPVRMEPAPMYVSCKLLFTTRNRTGKDSSKRALCSTRYVPQQLFAVSKQTPSCTRIGVQHTAAYLQLKRNCRSISSRKHL